MATVILQMVRERHASWGGGTPKGLAEVYRLRAYDALHLASAVTLRDSTSEVPTFACWDDELEAAAREGLPPLRTR